MLTQAIFISEHIYVIIVYTPLFVCSSLLTSYKIIKYHMRVDNTYSYRNSSYKLPTQKKNVIYEGYTSVFTLVTANINKCTQNIINQGQALSFILVSR